MEGFAPQLLDLIPKEKKWVLEEDEEKNYDDAEKKLVLRLGPPVEEEVEEDWRLKNNNTSGAKRVFSDRNGGGGGQNQSFNSWQKTNPPFLQLHQSKTIMESSQQQQQPCSSKANEKNPFSPSPANITAVVPPTSSSQKRSAAPVVGWPPIRSFRKNLSTNCSSKPVSEEQGSKPTDKAIGKQVENTKNGFFVKINMDGVPIGRKIDLKAYDSYDKLSSAVDELFRGLLAAQTQSDSSADRMIKEKIEGGKMITGLLDGTGEYTLVYEDNEGDRVLVGDVPWHMFVSSVKRLRVLKSSDIPKLFFVGNKHGKTTTINGTFG
ncbi:auxin-responsive protein IAA26-like [Impatiens glandulifera]|uniref:auxin-responsive protein IAA26-like n=1 Tax=Impatiens glandulifera TaxID=253017 RepID=UPI001FB0F8AC|nr:auxin-responsive protein IAA26-like [Impatiens glandulifera]